MRFKRKKFRWGRIYYWFVGYRSRFTYWNNGKFSDKLRKWFNIEAKPGAATEEEWDAWEERNKKKIGYWFVEEGLNLAQDIWLFIPDVYENIRTYITNRFIDKTHIIQTGFAPGGWYEYDDRILDRRRYTMMYPTHKEVHHD